MKVNLSPRFKHAYKHLPLHVQGDFDEKIKIFIQNPRDPKLRMHKLKGKLQTCLSFYLRDGFRVLFEFSTYNTVDLLDVGKHDKYKRWDKKF